MTTSVVVAPPEATVREVAELMRERNVGSVVLVDGDAPVGMLTDRDLAVGVVAEGRDPGDRAGDHASRPVVTVEPGAAIEDAADLMVGHGIRRLPVLDGDRLAGIVTLDDLAVRTGDAQLAAQLTTRVTRANAPEFYFLSRDG